MRGVLIADVGCESLVDLDRRRHLLPASFLLQLQLTGTRRQGLQANCVGQYYYSTTEATKQDRHVTMTLFNPASLRHRGYVCARADSSGYGGTQKVEGMEGRPPRTGGSVVSRARCCAKIGRLVSPLFGECKHVAEEDVCVVRPERHIGSQRNRMKIVRVDYEWVDGYYAHCHHHPNPPIESIHLHSGTEGRRKPETAGLTSRFAGLKARICAMLFLLPRSPARMQRLDSWARAFALRPAPSNASQSQFWDDDLS
jgi:hypothetical protein